MTLWCLGMGWVPRKGLGETSHSISSSSIHILYNQALVCGLSVRYVPNMWIGNLQLHGGTCTCMCMYSHTRDSRSVRGEGVDTQQWSRQWHREEGSLAHLHMSHVHDPSRGRMTRGLTESCPWHWSLVACQDSSNGIVK